MQAIFCGPRIYEYEGRLFEVHSYCGPWPLKKNGDPRKYAGHRFFEMFSRFDKLANAEQAQYRVGGGCTVLTGGSTLTGRAARSEE